MERRKALTIPFSVGKDNQMENPLRIPMTCLSPECGKLGQVPWTAFAGCKLRHSKSPHKNGSMRIDPKKVAMITQEIKRRKPILILENVLKTESGKEYIERIKKRNEMNKKPKTNGQQEILQLKEEPLACKETRFSPKELRNSGNNSVTPKRNQKTTPVASQRSRLSRKLLNLDDSARKEDTKKVGKDTIEKAKFAEVVAHSGEADRSKCEDVVSVVRSSDCGLSLSFEPSEDVSGCDELSSPSIKDRRSDSERGLLPSLKRKRDDSGSQCNGTSSPKRHRESVLCLTGEEKEGLTSSLDDTEQSEDDQSLEGHENIVQFTVGEDDRTEVLFPVISPILETGNAIGSPRKTDNTTQTIESEPIVLSSDDEESNDFSQSCSQSVRTLVTVEDAITQEQFSLQFETKQQDEASEMQVLQVVLEEDPHIMMGTPVFDMDSCVAVSFSTLHCGGCRAKANGEFTITKDKIVIPLKDTSEQCEMMLSFERRELRKYSIWEQYDMEERELHFYGDEEPPPASLLLWVSESAAAAVQEVLCQLCATQGEATNTGTASPFILVALRDPVEGMEGALLRSLLDLDCINTMTREQANPVYHRDSTGRFEDPLSPVLTLNDSIELIRCTGWDSELLSMLGLKNTDLEPELNQEKTHSDIDSNLTAHVQPEVDSEDAELEPETEPEEQMPKEDQGEQEQEQLSDKDEEGLLPVYTLCHQKTKGSYSVSLCKPDSSWIKYKHQGLARRLIQFPPPPLKGGITVTMEDLQCLDSGQYLNDVIIDFYLKYLLQNSSGTVTERSHIFSSFFYKQLTRRDNASEGGSNESCQRQRRHQRVKTWTRHVDIFEKDFLFVPVNQEAHWYLVVICFPGLQDPKIEEWTCSKYQRRNSESQDQDDQEKKTTRQSLSYNAVSSPMLQHSNDTDTEMENGQEEATKDSKPGPVNCTELTCQKKAVCKRPCILIMDSLKLSLHERVVKLLREYLQSEWEVRRGSSRDFSPDQMKSSHCHVPLQDNSSDCGLYLLQYVESFLKDPVVHFDLPLHLQRWFPRHQVRRKRDEIRDLILNLYRHQNLDRRTKQLNS
ncbi:sentrin-specific protease 7 isoform 2-T2 [Pholidichthys leucotaenia]